MLNVNICITPPIYCLIWSRKKYPRWWNIKKNADIKLHLQRTTYKYVPSLIRFFLPSVPIFSQNDSSFSSLRAATGGRGDFGLGDAILVLLLTAARPVWRITNHVYKYMYIHEHSRSLEIYRVIRNPTSHYRIHNSPPLVPFPAPDQSSPWPHPTSWKIYIIINTIIIIHLRLGLASGVYHRLPD